MKTLHKIRLGDILHSYSIEEAFIINCNRVAYNKSKGFSKSSDDKNYWESMHSPLKTLRNIKSNIYKYKFQPSLMIERRIKYKTRKLFISNWQDKIVETFLSKALNKKLNNYFCKESYAYRGEKVDINICQRQVIKAVKTSKHFFKCDIKNYFYSINQDILDQKIKMVVDENDALYDILKQKVFFSYLHDKESHTSTIGIPFGSPIACFLANIYLNDLDWKMKNFNIKYFRYADDILICGDDPDEILSAKSQLLDELKNLQLNINTDKSSLLSFCENDGFVSVNRLKYLGLEYTKDGLVRLPLEKKRKILNLFKRSLLANVSKLRKCVSIDEKLILCCSIIDDVSKRRIRSAAIIDYYLNNVTDMQQLKTMDLELAKIIIGLVLGKKFRMRDFRVIPYKTLRDRGLISLVYRAMLLKTGKLHVKFLSLFNQNMLERYMESHAKKKDRIDTLRAIKRIKKIV